jgi:NAD(P)-dependent dehydrogenase (short-subunit alcohol dehydrogenase family)
MIRRWRLFFINTHAYNKKQEENTMDRLNAKTALITGGARGIGREICKLFAREGAYVIVTDIIDDEGEQLVEEIRQNQGRAEYQHLDTSDEKNVADVISPADSLTILVNNAGIAGPNKPTHEIDVQEWDNLMNVNVRGVFLCTKYAIPHMQKNKGGSIINLSSIYGIVGAPDLPAYHASKGAVRLMSKTDALIYAKQGIRVNSLHPGYIWTPLVEELGKASEEGVDAFRKNLDSKHPVGHVGKPEDIAYGALYLASDESAFVTGSELVIDGGYTAQ